MSMAQQYLAKKKPTTLDAQGVAQALGLQSLPTSGNDLSAGLTAQQGNALLGGDFDYRTNDIMGIAGTNAGAYLAPQYGPAGENIDHGDRSTWGPVTGYEMRYSPSLAGMRTAARQTEATSNREAGIVQGIGTMLTTAGLGGAFGGGSLMQAAGGTGTGVLGTGVSTGMGVADAAIGGGLTNGAMTALQGGNFGRGFGSGLLSGGLGYMGGQYVSPYLQQMGLPAWAARPLAGAGMSAIGSAIQGKPINWMNLGIGAATGMMGGAAGLNPMQQRFLNMGGRALLGRRRGLLG